ncbi:MAG TPA: hypothetical protein VM077_04985 [Candidatus Limnocylindrales bacterium]|nr:hypothetical protein [Candidatus Limnocylindrales bacterium]
MKKFLPIFFALLLFGIAVLLPKPILAQTPAPQQMQQNGAVPNGQWVIDKEVTFIGKNAARSGKLLDFTLRNYNWVCVKQAANGQCDDSNNPLAGVWLSTVMFIVTPLLFVVIIVTAIIIIVTRGRSLTITRFIPRFIAVLLLIFLSFAILRFLYIFTDIIQGFFLRPPDSTVSCPPKCISQTDLLFVGWDYEKFIGLRLIGGIGDQNAESAFISLLLTKLTALTYFVMVGILFLRKIILWLFIIVAPIFPLLLLFYPVRNTGKIWIGEFFRWLLYAPLFAIFLKGLVSLWRDQIPLFFGNPNIGVAGKEIYPTAVNILLGGPKQYVTPTNSVNLPETFALYVVSLIMLWGVIILPWILLQIFLDYASNLGVGDSAVMKTLVNKISNLQSPPGSPAHPPSGGAAISLPFAKKFSLPVTPSAPTGMARELPTSTSISNVSKASYMPSAQVKAQVLSLTNLSIPSMRDIAKYDTSLISKDTDRLKETTIIQQNLEKIGNPTSSSSSTEKERYTEIREKLTQESKGGNTLATSILSAASTISSKSSRANTTQIKNILTQIANATSASSTSSTTGAASSARSDSSSASSSVSTSVINHEKLARMNESLVKAKQEGNTLAASILSVNSKTSSSEIEKLQERILDAKAKGEPIATQIAEIAAREATSKLPVVNRVQTVSKEDYQAVKDMWKDNYRNLDVPSGMSGTRAEWIKEDMAKINEIVALLSSKDEAEVNKGMEQVSSILPFLLVGGFSQAEIVAYLKAKQEAAKDVAAEIITDEDDKVSVNVKKTATATHTMSASLTEDSGDDDISESNLSSFGSASQNVSSSQASTELLNISNLKLPKLTDIVQYEIRHLTKDKTESERVEKIHEVLERLNNPQGITSAPEREQYELLKEKLTAESQLGNPTADVILSAVSQLSRTASEMDLTLSEIRVVLQQIVSPENVAASDDRDYYTKLHEYLENESKTKNNQLAQKILTVNESTKNSDIEEIKTQLFTTSQAGPVLPQVTAAVSDISSLKQLRATVSEIMSATTEESKSDNQITNSLYQTLKTESAKGNSLATSVLTLNNSTSEQEVRKVYQTISETAQKGDPIAASILSQISSSVSTVGQMGGKDMSVDDTKTFINQIVNPSVISNAEDRNYYSSLHEYVDKESKQSQNVLAQKIMSVNEATNNTDIQYIKDQLFTRDTGKTTSLPQITSAASEFNQLMNLRQVITGVSAKAAQPAQVNKKDLVNLRDSLSSEKAKGNSLATSIMSIDESTSDTKLRKIHNELIEAAKKGNPLAVSLLSKAKKPLSFSPSNRLQKVNPEDYEEAKKLWEKAYKQYFVPPGFTEDLKGRMEWINKDIVDIEETISLLTSGDTEKKEEGMKKVSNILPFLLLGGFSFDEMLKYLSTKLEAAKSALKFLTEEEENSVTVSIAKKQENTHEMSANDEEPDIEKKS